MKRARSYPFVPWLISIVLWAFLLSLLTGCSSSESPVVKAEIEISLDQNPAIITFDETCQRWRFQNCINFKEVKGVSGELEAIIFEVSSYITPLYKRIYESRKFRGFEAWKICIDINHERVMKNLQVTILGADEFGNRIEYSKVFFLTK